MEGARDTEIRGARGERFRGQGSRHYRRDGQGILNRDMRLSGRRFYYWGVDYVMNSKLFRLLTVCQLLCILKSCPLSPHFNYIDYIVIIQI